MKPDCKYLQTEHWGFVPGSHHHFQEISCCFGFAGVICALIHIVVPSQNMEISENHTKGEMDLLLEQLQDLRCKAESDKEALKKAVRAQKERAERSEEYVQKLTAQLAEKVPAETGEAQFEVMILNS